MISRACNSLSLSHTHTQTVATYFPGEFGSEQLVQRVIDMIISATEKKETDQVESAVHDTQLSDDNPPPMETGTIVYIYCKVINPSLLRNTIYMYM